MDLVGRDLGQQRRLKLAVQPPVARGQFVCAEVVLFFFSSRRRHTRFDCDWSSDVCSSDLVVPRNENGVKTFADLGGKKIGVLVQSVAQWVLTKRGLTTTPAFTEEELVEMEIGRACVGKECRSRWSPYH